MHLVYLVISNFTMASQKKARAHAPNFDLGATAQDKFSLDVEAKFAKRMPPRQSPYDRKEKKGQKQNEEQNKEQRFIDYLEMMRNKYPGATRTDLLQMYEQDIEGRGDIFDRMAERFRFKFPQNPFFLLADMMENGIYQTLFGDKYIIENRDERLSFIEDDGKYRWEVGVESINLDHDYKVYTLRFWKEDKEKWPNNITYPTTRITTKSGESKRVAPVFPWISLVVRETEVNEEGRTISVRLHFKPNKIFMEKTKINGFPNGNLDFKFSIFIPSSVENYQRVPIDMSTLHKYKFLDNFSVKVNWAAPEIWERTEDSDGESDYEFRKNRADGPSNMGFYVTHWYNIDKWNILRNIGRELLNVTPNDHKTYQDQFGAIVDVHAFEYSDNYRLDYLLRNRAAKRLQHSLFFQRTLPEVGWEATDHDLDIEDIIGSPFQPKLKPIAPQPGGNGV